MSQVEEENNITGQVALTRDLRVFDITMIGVGAMIGAGVFVLTGLAAGQAGSALLLAFFLNGLVSLFTATSYAEQGVAFPEAGGGYAWAREGLSTYFGFLSGGCPGSPRPSRAAFTPWALAPSPPVCCPWPKSRSVVVLNRAWPSSSDTCRHRGRSPR